MPHIHLQVEVTNERKTFFKKIRGANHNPEAEMSFVDHLEELRWHLFRSALVWVVLAFVIFFKVDWVVDNIIYAPANSDFITYRFLCNLSHKLHLGEALCMPPVHISLQLNSVSGPFMAAISIAMVGGLVAAAPYIFWEIWRFVKPALSEKETQYFKHSIFWVVLCFFLGAAFGYYLLAPFTFNFLASFRLGNTTTYTYLPTLDDFIDTITNIILGCGIGFELPVLAYVLAKVGILDADFLKKYRNYAIILILFLAAIITPSPDWTSQLIVAVPLWLLYEVSVYLVGRVDKQRAEEEKQWE